jgi:hypothetical protein
MRLRVRQLFAKRINIELAVVLNLILVGSSHAAVAAVAEPEEEGLHQGDVEDGGQQQPQRAVPQVPTTMK